MDEGRTDIRNCRSEMSQDGRTRITHLTFDRELGAHVDLANPACKERDDCGREDEEGRHEHHRSQPEEHVYCSLQDCVKGSREGCIH